MSAKARRHQLSCRCLLASALMFAVTHVWSPFFICLVSPDFSSSGAYKLVIRELGLPHVV